MGKGVQVPFSFGEVKLIGAGWVSLEFGQLHAVRN